MDGLLHALAGFCVVVLAIRLAARGRRLFEIIGLVALFGVAREVVQHWSCWPWSFSIHVCWEACAWGAGALLAPEVMRAGQHWYERSASRGRVALMGTVLLCVLLSGCTVAQNLARTFSPGGGARLYRIEHRPELVCVPEKPWGEYVEACVRALSFLGGGVIEVKQ